MDQRKLNGKLEYLIKWEGFPLSESTWEISSDFHCPGLLDNFLIRTGRKAPPRISTRITKGKRNIRYVKKSAL
jgi:hypothetical protein